MRLASAFLVLLTSSLLAVSAQAQIDGRQCATPEPTVTEALQLSQQVRLFQARVADVGRAGPITVPVAVHVVSEGDGVAQGNVPQARIEAQIDTLNVTFGPLGVQFALALVQRVENAAWYRDLRLDSEEERAMKRALALDPARVLNLYTVSPALDYLGWATLPDAQAEADREQGVVLLDQSLPGGDAAPFDRGHTGTHEVGHWAGLLHPFAGGCSEPGDGVADTPQQRSASTGCQTTRDSCPLDPGLDPVRNYMGYSDDGCMTEFTPGQRERSRALLGQFRPTLTAGGFALATVPQADLAEAFVGLGAPTVLRVTNASDAPFAVTGVAASGRLAVAAAGLPATVAPGQAVALALTVEPSAQGAFSETLTVTTTRSVEPTLAVPLQGTAFVPPTARLSTTAVEARVTDGGPAERSVTLANDGGRPLSFSVELGALPAWVASVSPASGEVPPQGAATLAISLTTTTLAPGAYAEPLVIQTNDPVQGDVVITAGLPSALAVLPVWPNPARGPVTIPLALPQAETVRVEVYDARGRRVAVVADGAPLEAGYPTLRWDASGAAAGLYLVRVTTGAQHVVGQLTVVR